MKYGLNLLLWTASVDESHLPLLEQIKSWGYDGVELPVFAADPELAGKLGKQLKNLGLGCTAVVAFNEEHDLISPDANVRAAGEEELKRRIDHVAALGGTHVVGPMHSALGKFSGAGPTSDEWKRSQESLARVADYAQKQNVILCVEALNRFECYLLNTHADSARFCREVGHSHLKMMYDTFHANIEEKDVTAALTACQDQLAHVHISENDRSTPGEGQVKWDESFAGLAKIGYDGWLTIEAFGLAMPEVAAATRIWRRMFPNEEHLATRGLAFMKAKSSPRK